MKAYITLDEYGTSDKSTGLQEKEFIRGEVRFL